MSVTKDEAARVLARGHYAVEPALDAVYRLVGTDDVEADGDEPVKLLEVNRDALPVGISPVHFRPTPDLGIPFSCLIIDVSPDEFASIRSGRLDLPNDWAIGGLLPRETISKPVAG